MNKKRKFYQTVKDADYEYILDRYPSFALRVFVSIALFLVCILINVIYFDSLPLFLISACIFYLLYRLLLPLSKMQMVWANRSSIAVEIVNEEKEILSRMMRIREILKSYHDNERSITPTNLLTLNNAHVNLSVDNSSVSISQDEIYRISKAKENIDLMTPYVLMTPYIS